MTEHYAAREYDSKYFVTLSFTCRGLKVYE